MIVLSLGAGVQSTTLLLMACLGELLPRPDFAIFADTGWEPPAVYKHLDWLEIEAAKYGLPLVRVSKGNLRDDLIAASEGKRFASIPFHLRVVKGNNWTKGMARRQCTSEYKLDPLLRKLRELGAHRKTPAEVWIGISTDEVTRCRPSRVQYAVNRWPLIEQNKSRLDCLTWLSEHGYPTPPKSSCIGCPFHDNAAWRKLREDPVAWADALATDEAIRQMPRFYGVAYLHPSLLPLGEAPIDEVDTGQFSLFENECEGMCGV